jgi:phosphopantetheine adenylyltransferase
VREVAYFGGDFSRFVHPVVGEALKRKVVERRAMNA